MRFSLFTEKSLSALDPSVSRLLWVLVVRFVFPLCIAISTPAVHACSPTELSTLLREAQEAESRGAWRNLETTGERAVVLCSKDGAGYHWLGLAYLRRGNTFAAVRAFRAALQFGGIATSHLRLAEAYFVLSQDRFFEEEIAAAKSASPDDPEPYYVEGRFFFQRKQMFAKAEELYRKALSKDPVHVKSLTHLALCLRNMQQDEEPELLLKKSIEKIEKIEKIDALDTSYYLPYQLLATLYLDRNKSGLALPLILRAAKMAPEVAENHFLMGKIQLAQNDDSGAEASILRAMKLDEALVEGHYLLARIYRDRGDTVAANRELNTFKERKELYGTRRLR